MTEQEIRLGCFQVGCTVRGGEPSQLSAVNTIVKWVDGDEFKLQCIKAAVGQGITGKGLLDRAESILKFCKNEPLPKPVPKPVAVKKTFTRGGRRTR